MKKVSKIFLSLAVILFASSLLFACAPNNYDTEQQQIEATIHTSYRLVAMHSIDNTITFTNVLDKHAEIKITYKFNNGASFSDTVIVEAYAPFSKTYSGGYSVATFSIKILSLT